MKNIKWYDTFEEAKLLCLFNKVFPILIDSDETCNHITTAFGPYTSYRCQDVVELMDFLHKFFSEILCHSIYKTPYDDDITRLNDESINTRNCLKSLKEFIDVFEKEK